MNQQDNLEPNSQQPRIEDLPVNEDKAAEVKGGAEEAKGGRVVFVGGWGSSSYQY